MKQVYVALLLVLLGHQALADQMGQQQHMVEETIIGDFLRMEDPIEDGPFMFVKCEELGGKCLHEHQVNHHCSGDKSTDNGGKCFHKKMLCCAPVMTYSSEGWNTEGTDGTGESMATDEQVMGTDESGDFLRFRDPIEDGPFMFVKCEELGGKCLHQHQVEHHCSGDKSTDNDGKCFHKKMLCCAPVMTFSSEGLSTESTDGIED